MKKVMLKAEKNEQERGEKRKREEEKEENETETARRRCEGFVSVKALKICGQGRALESCADLSWEDPLEEFENWSDCEYGSRARVRVVSGVTDVLVSLSSVVTELCNFFFLLLFLGICGTAVLFFLPEACSRLDSHAGRDEVRRFTSESAPAFKKKNDAAHTTAKFEYII